MAIAPTATISNIQGVAQSIEPIFSNLFVKSNLSGEFTIVNESLVEELEARGLWDADLLDEIKYWDGSIAAISRIPDDIKLRYPTAFEVEPGWLIEAASRRQKWIDMGQSLNLYIAEPSGKKLHEMYMLAWKKGLKTTYYLRSRGATTNEKSTIDVNRYGVQPRWMKSASASGSIRIDRNAPAASLTPPIERQAIAETPVVEAPAVLVAPAAVLEPTPIIEPQAIAETPLVAPEAMLAQAPAETPDDALRMRNSQDLLVDEEFECEACQ
jgi:ribonucleoside-diphosphate reductase alpha chain